ncbi:MAG: hypothetical protein M3299_07115 [Thermoproteota archaeon]|nr:hypothetical protein [Thermoproteota archaeon]
MKDSKKECEDVLELIFWDYLHSKESRVITERSDVLKLKIHKFGSLNMMNGWG